MINWYKKILSSGYETSDKKLNNYRKRIVNLTVLWAVPILLIFSIVNIKSNIHFLAYVDIISAVTLLLTFFYLKKTKDVFISSIGTLLAMYFIFTGALFSAGIANSSFFWFFVFPPLSIFFFGSKRGLYYIYGLLLTIVIFYIYAKSVQLELTYDIKLLIVLVLALAMITIFTVFYEKIREDYEKTIINQKEELEKQKQAYETLYQKSSDGILIIKDKKFVDCNESIVKMLKYKDKNELLNIHPSQLSPEFQPDGRSSFEKANEMMNKAFKNGGHHFEWVHTKSGGEYFWAEIVLTPISLTDGDILHVVWRDISDRKEMEQKLEELNKSLEQKVKEEVEKNREKDKQLLHQSRLAQMGEMLSMIAHQWRQPLTAISSTANTLTLDIMMNNYKKEFFEEQVNNIAGYSQHLSSTIDDFRDFFKNNKEKSEITLEELVNSTLSIINTSLKNKNISIKTDFNCNEKINSYPNELKQVVLNLIKNAEDILLEKKIENPEIQIRTFKKDGFCYLRVEDNAGGISDQIIDKVFDPYFTTKEKKMEQAWVFICLKPL